jgi:gliding motility-associated lipoprotein GldH
MLGQKWILERTANRGPQLSGKVIPFLLLSLSCGLWLSSCQTVDLYEKNLAIPKHAWSSSFKPEFRFTIKDTSVPYNIFIVLRHNEQYNYNNIWLNLTTQSPGGTVQKEKIELPLATTEKGWLGTGMDDLYEHRILITPGPPDLYLKKGDYIFTIEQVMREDPLRNVFNIGLRVEKKQQ